MNLPGFGEEEGVGEEGEDEVEDEEGGGGEFALNRWS